MKPLLKKMAAVMRYNIQIQLAYRARLSIWILVDTLRLAMFPIIWIAALGGDTVEGYNQSSIITYFLGIYVVGMFVYQHGYTWITTHIRDGELSTHLIRPLKYMRFVGSLEVGSIVKLLMSLPVVILFVLLLHNYIYVPSDTQTVLYVVLALMLAIVAHMSISHMLDMVAFWLDDTKGVTNGYWALSVVLAGGVAPLEFLPGALQQIALWTPFRYFGAFPVEIYLERLQPGELLQGFVLLIGWIIVLHLASRLMWKIGVKRYSGIGM